MERFFDRIFGICFSFRTFAILCAVVVAVSFFLVKRAVPRYPACVDRIVQLMEHRVSQREGWACLDGRFKTLYRDPDDWFYRYGQDVEVIYVDRDRDDAWLVVYGITYLKDGVVQRDRSFVTLDDKGYITSLVVR